MAYLRNSQQANYWRGPGKREADAGDNRELWQTNEAITSGSSKKSFGQQCGDDRKEETVHGRPVRKWWQGRLGNEGRVLNKLN